MHKIRMKGVRWKEQRFHLQEQVNGSQLHDIRDRNSMATTVHRDIYLLQIGLHYFTQLRTSTEPVVLVISWSPLTSYRGSSLSHQKLALNREWLSTASQNRRAQSEQASHSCGGQIGRLEGIGEDRGFRDTKKWIEGLDRESQSTP